MQTRESPTLAPGECGSTAHLNRRTLLKTTAAGGLAWLTPVAEILARDAEASRGRVRPKSVIMLWLAGGPSQLETFDPHAGRSIASGTEAIGTREKSIQLAAGMDRLAQQMDVVTLVRNVVSKEGDHERATYNAKTGFRPVPALVHPSIGAVVCHELPVGKVEIPRHVSIMPGSAYGRGGYLGDEFDAFKLNDVQQSLPDVHRQVSDYRFAHRLEGLKILDAQFARGRLADLEARRTLHRSTIDRAVTMMNSEQLKAFDIREEPRDLIDEFGDSAFGRGCLAALRLINVGVRCVEITLGGWDSHINNHSIHDARKATLDPAFAALLKQLRLRELLDETIVVCGGEFGRTPEVNPAGGRDHWPHGFSVALAGGGIRRGAVIGATDPDGGKVPYEKGTPIADLHATVMHLLGIEHDRELETPIGRPMKLSEGKVIEEMVERE